MTNALLSACAMSALALGIAMPASAQTAPATGVPSSSPEAAKAPAAADTADEPTRDIIVTATRRNSLLSDVPLAVSAVSSASLSNSGANDIRQLNQLAPSLLVSSTGSEANGSARIRGIGTVGDNPGLESSVATFIDGVYRSRTGAGLNDLGEIDRIEVLRGPQGTLFGRNASAGLLNIITKAPSFTFGANGELTYGNYNAVRASGSITGPITETIAARLDGVYSKRDGFYTDAVTGQRLNNRDRYFVRGQLLYQPTADLSVRLIGDYTHRVESCCAAVYVSTVETYDPTPGAAGTNPEHDYASRTNRITDVMTSMGAVFPGGVYPANMTPYNRLTSDTPGRSFRGKTTDGGISGEINWKIGDVALTSITAYREYKAEAPGDVDYSNIDLLYRAADGNSFRQFKTFSQELRLQGSLFKDRLDWLVGGYFSNEDLTVRDNLKFGSQYGAFAACRLVATINAAAVLRNPSAPGCLSPTGIATLTGAFGAAAPIFINGLNTLSTVNNVGDNNANYYQRSRNFAFFTHNIVHITPTLDLTLGLRYTHEEKTFRADFNNTNTVCPAQQAFFAPFLTGGAAALPASLQSLAAGVVNLTCQGNSSSALNALKLSDKRKEGEFTGTAVLSWKPTTGVLTYASYSRGYKAGGFNLDRSALGQPIFSPTDPRQFGGRGAGFGTANLQFDAEKVNAYEVGVKYTSRRFNLNVAAFQQDFKDFQLNTFNGSVFLVQNIDSCSTDLAGADRDASASTGACDPNNVRPGVRTRGVEVEAAIYPTRNVAFTAGYTLADTKFRNNLVGRNTGAPLDPALFLLPGQALSNAPRNVVTSSIAWTPRLGNSGLSGLIYVDQRTTSDYNTGSDLFPEKKQDGFTTVNARVGIRGPKEQWAIELWAQNLTNTQYEQVAFSTPFQGSNSVANVQAFGGTANQTISAFLAEPRTYGVTLRGKF
ncbi:MAG: TonB-dependent receptor [Sphingomonas sp.]|uniref:TonB-dependent receptor n=1 Tax=unclassified Sphingomonas TaxID=196159 RepID=UPI0030F6B031